MVLDLDVQRLSRNAAFGSFRPLDQHQGLVAQHVIPSKVDELSRRIQTIEIEVIDGKARPVVPLYQRERGRRHKIANPGALTDRLCECRLPCAKLSGNCDHQCRGNGTPKLLTP